MFCTTAMKEYLAEEKGGQLTEHVSRKVKLGMDLWFVENTAESVKNKI